VNLVHNPNFERFGELGISKAWSFQHLQLIATMVFVVVDVANSY
jgi:hypothetical protein